MLKTLTFIRHNAIALLALFVALGGTSYAAFSLPAGSVGSRQLKNHAVTPAKLESDRSRQRSAGRVGDSDSDRRDSGRVVASQPRATRCLVLKRRYRLVGWSSVEATDLAGAAWRP